MPTPLTATGSSKFPIGQQIVAVISLGLPAVGLWYCFNYGKTIHFDEPHWNLCAHAGLFLFPALWIWLFQATPVIYQSSDADIDLGPTSFFGTLRGAWWTMFMMWATPLFAVYALAEALGRKYIQQPDALSTSPGRAIYIMLVIFAVGIFFSTILLNRSSPTVRLSSEGVRTGIIRFHKWEAIDHVSRHGNLYLLHLRVNPALPAGTFRIARQDLQATFETYLSENQVPISNATSPAYTVVRIAVVLGFAVNLFADYALRSRTTLSLPTILVISMGIGVALTLLLEKYRGVSKYGKYKPVMKFDEDLPSGNPQTDFDRTGKQF